MRGWRLVETYQHVKTYTKGDMVRHVYPKAPRWAQAVAMQIWKDIESGGMPTRKGIKDCVKGQWAKMIAEGARRC